MYVFCTIVLDLNLHFKYIKYALFNSLIFIYYQEIYYRVAKKFGHTVLCLSDH